MEQDKAVALAEKYGAIAALSTESILRFKLAEQQITAMLTDRRQQIIEELAKKPGVMPTPEEIGDRHWSELMCDPDKVYEAIATMQAKVEQANHNCDEWRQTAICENERFRIAEYNLSQAQARLVELEKALKHIAEMKPNTSEVTLAHDMADIADAAMKGQQP